MECMSQRGAHGQLHPRIAIYSSLCILLRSILLLGLLHECLAGVPSPAEGLKAPVGSPVSARGPAMGPVLAGSLSPQASPPTFKLFMNPDVQKSAFRINGATLAIEPLLKHNAWGYSHTCHVFGPGCKACVILLIANEFRQASSAQRSDIFHVMCQRSPFQKGVYLAHP